MRKIRKTVLLWCILFMTFYFTGCGSGQERDTETALKRDDGESIIRREMFVLLDEYRRACADAAYTRDQWKEIDDNFICYWYRETGYSFQDINGDGEDELVIGCLYDSGFYPVIIHTYDKGDMVSWGITDYYRMTIFGGGILWVEQAEAPKDTYIYRLTAAPDMIEEASRQTSIRGNEIQPSGNENFEHLEDYFCKVPKELEWKPLTESDGFADEEDTAAGEQKIIISLLEEYERACRDVVYTEGKWRKIDTAFSLYFNREIGYCMKDINGDTLAELIIGYRCDSKYCPFIIHVYDPDSGTMPGWSVSDYYDMEIYENGIINVRSEGMIFSDFIYEISSNMNMDMVRRLYIDARDEENVLFYDETEGNRNRITQEEFEELRRRYLSTPAEMEWKPLEGFWNP